MTSAGLDDIPYWIFEDCASLLSAVITAMISYSINSGWPTAWKRSFIITPVHNIPVASVAVPTVTPIF